MTAGELHQGTGPHDLWAILQKTGDGMLVERKGGHTGQVEINRSPLSGINVVGGMGIFKGSCLLRNHPEEGRFVDGDRVEILA